MDQPVVDVVRKVDCSELSRDAGVQFVQASCLLIMETLLKGLLRRLLRMHLVGNRPPCFVQMFPNGSDGPRKPISSDGLARFAAVLVV